MMLSSELVIHQRHLTSLRNNSGFMRLADELLFTRRALATAGRRYYKWGLQRPATETLYEE
jgi:hypothetical protein